MLLSILKCPYHDIIFIISLLFLRLTLFNYHDIKILGLKNNNNNKYASNIPIIEQRS
jgi:hypothetical protein